MSGAVQANHWTILHLIPVSGEEPKDKKHSTRVTAVPVLRQPWGDRQISPANGEKPGEWLRAAWCHPISIYPTLPNRVAAKWLALMVHHRYSQIMKLWWLLQSHTDVHSLSPPSCLRVSHALQQEGILCSGLWVAGSAKNVLPSKIYNAHGVINYFNDLSNTFGYFMQGNKSFEELRASENSSVVVGTWEVLYWSSYWSWLFRIKS